MRGATNIRIERRLPASCERVFDAWLDPTWIGRFMFGAHLRDEQVVSFTNEPRVGGQFHYVITRQGAAIDHTGTYCEIDRPRRLVFTWGVNEEQGEKSVVTLTFTPDGDHCLLRLSHALHPDWAEYAERTRAGWNKILDDLRTSL